MTRDLAPQLVASERKAVDREPGIESARGRGQQPAEFRERKEERARERRTQGNKPSIPRRFQDLEDKLVHVDGDRASRWARHLRLWRECAQRRIDVVPPARPRADE